jgi:hypothetical protein
MTCSERHTPFFLAALSIMSEASWVLFFVSSHLTDSGISLEMQGNYFISVLKIYIQSGLSLNRLSGLTTLILGRGEGRWINGDKRN